MQNRAGFSKTFSGRAGPGDRRAFPLRAQCRCSSRTLHSRTCPFFPRACPPPHQSSAASVPTLSFQTWSFPCFFPSPSKISERAETLSPVPLKQVRPQTCPVSSVPHPLPRAHHKLDSPSPFHSTLPSTKGSSREKLDQQTFMAQVRKYRDKGYLLSSKTSSRAFSKVYLAYATQGQAIPSWPPTFEASATPW